MALLWFRRASNGFGVERYTLQMPFQFGPSHKLVKEPEPLLFNINSLTVEIIENEGVHLLRVSGFPSSKDAEAFLPRLHGALLRLTVLKKLSLRTNSRLQTIALHDPPIDVRNNPNFGGLMDHIGWTHIDGWLDPSPSAVIPEHLRLLEMGAGSVTASVGMRTDSFVDGLREGLALPSPEGIVADDRLSLAIDLYAASLREATPSARVVSLATTLEALIQPKAVSPYVRAHIEELLRSLKTYRELKTESPDQRADLERLKSRLADLKYESISQRLKNLAIAHANALGETPEDAAKNIGKAYGTRSELLHEGHAEMSAVEYASSWLQEAVPKILEDRISRACGEPRHRS